MLDASGLTGRVCQSSRLPEDSHFKFYIQCVNQFGNVTTSSTRIGRFSTLNEIWREIYLHPYNWLKVIFLICDNCY